MTGGKKCGICKLVALLAGIGALNWGLVALLGLDLVQAILGTVPTVAKVVYVLIGLSGIALLVSLVKCCPACTGQGCETKK